MYKNITLIIIASCTIFILSSCSNIKNRTLEKKSYHKNGEVWEIWHENSSGLKHGKALTFYENGNKKTDAMFKNGYLDGLFLMWDRQGNEIANGIYKVGQPWEGKFISINESMQKVEFNKYKDGKLMKQNF